MDKQQDEVQHWIAATFLAAEIEAPDGTPITLYACLKGATDISPSTPLRLRDGLRKSLESAGWNWCVSVHMTPASSIQPRIEKPSPLTTGTNTEKCAKPARKARKAGSNLKATTEPTGTRWALMNLS